MQRVLDYAAYVALRLFICLVQALSVECGHRLATGLAWLCTDVIRLRHRVVEENLRHAFPEWSAAQRRAVTLGMWEHLFLLVVEAAHVPRKLHETNWRQFVECRNIEPVVETLLCQRPLILVTGHFGNFEVGGYLLGLFGYPTHSVARTLDNPFLNDFVKRFRGATGQHLIPKNGGYDQILDVLSQDGTMAFLADQAAGPKGCWVDFFGRKASAYKAIGLLMLEYQAPLAVVHSRRLECPMRFEMTVRAMIDPTDPSSGPGSVRQITQWYTRQLEDAVRETPEQYWWIHRRWKDYSRRARADDGETAPDRSTPRAA